MLRTCLLVLYCLTGHSIAGAQNSTYELKALIFVPQTGCFVFLCEVVRQVQPQEGTEERLR